MRIVLPAVLLSLCALNPSATSADKPNVLILFTDDQRADTIRALGNDDIHTPNLDELVQRGCNVSSTYCLGANMGAVCRPSRNMLLSGRTYFRWSNPSQGKPQRNAPALPNTLPATFNAAGYETYHHGKRGNTAELIHKQFDHSHYLDDFVDRWSTEAGRKIVDDAIAFLNQRKDSESPWLMYLAFATPHDPRAASPAALARYNAEKLQLSPAAAEAHPFDNGAVLVRDEWTAVWPRTPQVLRDQLHDYYAVISTIDANIGRLLEDLKARGHYENTIVAFSSDHGLSMGDHGLMGKQNVYEHGYKAPMVIAGPGVKHGSKDDPVYLMDLFPTLCELTGVPIPNGLDGRSFAPMVTGDVDGPRDAVMLSYTDVQRAVRHDGWKLIRYPQINRTQLFHLSRDPDELNDLANDPAQKSRIQSLMAKMRQLQAEQGDELALTSEDPEGGTFNPPLPQLARSVAPSLGEGKPGSKPLRSTRVVGGTGSPAGTPFTVVRPEGGYFTAIAVGHWRTRPRVVTGLRFDLVGPAGTDDDRWTVIAGDPNARWTPLLDQMKPNRQPIGIHGVAGQVVQRVGILQSDGRLSQAFGGGGRDNVFDVRIPDSNRDAKDWADAFQGFHGTVVQQSGQTTIQSLGLLFTPVE